MRLDPFATKTIANASERMWEVLEDSVVQRHPARPRPEPTVIEAEHRAAK